MPKRRLSIRSMFYVAVLIALVATFGAYRALQATKLGRPDDVRTVVTALHDIPEGATITRDQLTQAKLPTISVSADAFRVPDSLVGRVTRVPIFAGDVIVPARLAPVGSGPGLEVKIAPGKRAMAVKVDDVAGLSGLIQPNSHVDVLVTLRTPDGLDRRVAKLFMENVRVLSVGSVVQRGTDGKPIDASTATLEVTPAEAERLAVAMHQGTIQLVLRGYGDPVNVTTSGANSGDVLAQLRGAPIVDPAATAPAPQRRAPRTEPRPAPPVVHAPRSDSAVIRVYRGSGEVVEKKVERTDSTRRRPPQR